MVKNFSNIGVELDVCNDCNGLWFDLGELLTAIGGLHNKAPYETRSFMGKISKHDQQRPCPCCSTSMSHISHNSIDLDFCQSCKGFWLDAGELLAIRRQFGEEKDRDENTIKSLPQELESVQSLLKLERQSIIEANRSRTNSEIQWDDSVEACEELLLETVCEFLVELWISHL